MNYPPTFHIKESAGARLRGGGGMQRQPGHCKGKPANHPVDSPMGKCNGWMVLYSTVATETSTKRCRRLHLKVASLYPCLKKSHQCRHPSSQISSAESENICRCENQSLKWWNCVAEDFISAWLQGPSWTRHRVFVLHAAGYGGGGGLIS